MVNVDLESLLDQHVKITRKLEELFNKLNEGEEVEESEKEIIHLLWKLSIIRRKIKRLFREENNYTDDMLTLLEYYSLIGLNDEEELLQRALSYGSKGHKLLASRSEELKTSINELRELKETIERLFNP